MGSGYPCPRVPAGTHRWDVAGAVRTRAESCGCGAGAGTTLHLWACADKGLNNDGIENAFANLTQILKSLCYHGY